MCHNLVKWERTNISSEGFWIMLTGNRKGYYVPGDKVFPFISFLLLLILTKHCCDHLK